MCIHLIFPSALSIFQKCGPLMVVSSLSPDFSNCEHGAKHIPGLKTVWFPSFRWTEMTRLSVFGSNLMVQTHMDSGTRHLVVDITDEVGSRGFLRVSMGLALSTVPSPSLGSLSTSSVIFTGSGHAGDAAIALHHEVYPHQEGSL